jgi:hypothetical protein
MEAPLRHLADTKDIFCCDTRYHSLVLNATYSYVHPHEINVGKTVGIPHENRGSSPLWATAYPQPTAKDEAIISCHNIS